MMQTTYQQFVWGGVVVFFVGLLFLAGFIIPAPDFSPKTVTIRSGQSITKTAQQLAKANIISFGYTVSIPLRLQKQTIEAGTYKFAKPQSPLAITRRLNNGDFQIKQTQITIPEGSTREDIAEKLANKSDLSLTKSEFLRASEGDQGHLFPDTYRLADNVTAEAVVAMMRDNFRGKIKSLQPQINQLPYTLDQVVTMASLIEREAADYQVRRRVAGVLWNRYDQGMKLQVDAVFAYLLGKASDELTQEDLRIDSPYNLYKNTGLPPTPIANPGLDSIRAAVDPIRTDYLYYLTGDNGNFYFAETLEEHNKNKREYIE